MKELGRLVSYTQNVTCALPGGSQAYNTSLDVAVRSFNRVRLCDLMDCSLPGFHVLHYLRKLAQTHVR